MMLLEIDVQDGKGKIRAALSDITEVERLRSFIRDANETCINCGEPRGEEEIGCHVYPLDEALKKAQSGTMEIIAKYLELKFGNSTLTGKEAAAAIRRLNGPTIRALSVE